MLPLAGQVKARKTGGNREYLCWLSDPQYPKAQGLIGTPKKRKEKKKNIMVSNVNRSPSPMPVLKTQQEIKILNIYCKYRISVEKGWINSSGIH